MMYDGLLYQLAHTVDHAYTALASPKTTLKSQQQSFPPQFAIYHWLLLQKTFPSNPVN